MNTTKTYGGAHNEMSAAKLVKDGSIISGVMSLIVIVLTLIAMGNILPRLMISLAVITASVAFLSQGGTIATRFTDLLPEANKQRREMLKLGAGVSVEVGGGVIAGILGILTLLTIMPSVLVPVAVLVLGITMIFGSGVAFWFESLLTRRTGELVEYGGAGHEALMASGGLQFVLGIAAFILGVLSLSGMAPQLMISAGLLCIGFSEALTGTAMSARMWNYSPQPVST